MLKFIKHNFDGMNGVDIFPIISLVLFFIIFVGYTIYALTYSKDRAKEMSELPFND